MQSSMPNGSAILATLPKTGGNKTQAAKLPGIGTRTLHRKLKESGIGRTAHTKHTH
ncbi:MAG: hypothetical protein M1377_03560 [Deltaproteobacteria bacterium]|nr:hypothetical protein [Deltaproteobacteria bacterium]